MLGVGGGGAQCYFDTNGVCMLELLGCLSGGKNDLFQVISSHKNAPTKGLFLSNICPQQVINFFYGSIHGILLNKSGPIKDMLCVSSLDMYHQDVLPPTLVTFKEMA